MSKVFIEESTLTAIGDAIREKNGTTDMIAPLDMATAITNLPSGGGGNLALKTASWYNTGTTYLTKFSLDFSEELGVEDNKPFYFYMQGYYNSSSYPSSLILYYDGNQVSVLNKWPDTTSTNYLVARYSSASISNGILTVKFKDKIYQTSNSYNVAIYYLWYVE